jgi:hypothetical protein
MYVCAYVFVSVNTYVFVSVHTYVFVSVHIPACMYLSEISNLRKGTLNTNSHIFLEFVTLFLLVTCTEVSIVKPKKKGEIFIPHKLLSSTGIKLPWFELTVVLQSYKYSRK